MSLLSKKEITYPIFLECSTFASDVFWKTIFEDLAYGKCPYGCYIYKDFFSCNFKTKRFSYKIEMDNPRSLYDAIVNLLTNKVGVMSHHDKFQQRIDFTKVEQDIKASRNKWAHIRRKTVKDLLLEDYVLRMKQQHSLNMQQTKYLLSLLFIGIIFKIILPKDIDFKDGTIVNIRGVVFSKNKVSLCQNIFGTYSLNDDEDRSTVSVTTPYLAVTSKQMSDLWEKYLKALRKLVM